MVAVPDWLPLWELVVVVAVVASVAALWWLARPRGRWGVAVRRRFVLGVPWGTALTVGVVLGFYLFVQGGWNHWFRPVVLPFRAWSYFYPLGVLTAGLAHAGSNHLVGNLLGTVVFGTIAEYAWGHFPTDRGTTTFASLRTNPVARVLAFPVVAVLAAVVTGAFGLGPVVGFSGVVFAFAGFGLVRYPVVTVVAIAAGNVVDLLYRALNDPVVVASPGPSFSGPWWAGIAIQGHALGLFLGVVVAAAVLWRRGESPPAGRVWLAALAFTVSKGLWAVYTFRGGSTFVLYRAGGLALTFLLAALVTAGVAASGRDLVARIDLSRREAAVGLLVCVLLALAVVAVPYNLLTVGNPDVGQADGAVEVRDYTVYYAEGVPHQLVAAYDVPGIDSATNVTASGVIVVNPERGIWWETVSKDRLAFTGRARVRVGGVGWREVVVADRTGWTTVGGPATYKVFLHRAGGDPQLAFMADPATAAPTVAGRNVTVAPRTRGFGVVVSRNDSTLGRAPMPARNASVRVGGLRLVHRGQALYAVHNDTRVQVASEETYQ